MQQLSGLDATFLYLETPEMPMHVGALHVLELPPGRRVRYVTALRRHVAARLPALPVLRRRLWWMPLNLANPAWVDAEPDLEQHIVEVELPPGSGLPELEDAVARLHPVLLDRHRPLWKMHVFEGLAPGPDGRRRVGLYTQLHHAAVDGQAAVALAQGLLDTEPGVQRGVPRRRKGGDADAVYQLGMVEMLRGALGQQVTKVAQIVRELPSTVGTLKDAALLAASRSEWLGGAKRPSNITLAPRLPINASVTTERAYATVTLPLLELRVLARTHGATLNDLVLWLAGSALRSYYARRRALPRKSLVAAVPISLRQVGDAAPDNQASMSLVSLGTHLSDPKKRLAHVLAATAAMKATMGSLRSVLPTDYPSLGVPWLIEAATVLYGKAKVADRIPQVANLVISNVPGPPVPLYLAGARMLTNYPTSIVVHGLGLNLTVQSYDQQMDFGFMADAQAMPDVKVLADDLRRAFDELHALDQPPSEHAEAPTLIDLAWRGLDQAVGAATGVAARTARGVVDSAVRAAVSQVGARTRKAPASKARRSKDAK